MATVNGHTRDERAKGMDDGVILIGFALALFLVVNVAVLMFGERSKFVADGPPPPTISRTTGQGGSPTPDTPAPPEQLKK